MTFNKEKEIVDTYPNNFKQSPDHHYEIVEMRDTNGNSLTIEGYILRQQAKT